MNNRCCRRIPRVGRPCDELPYHLRCSWCAENLEQPDPRPKFREGQDVFWGVREGFFRIGQVLDIGARKYGSTAFTQFSYAGLWFAPDRNPECMVLGESVLTDERWEDVNDNDLRVTPDRKIQRRVRS